MHQRNGLYGMLGDVETDVVEGGKWFPPEHVFSWTTSFSYLTTGRAEQWSEKRNVGQTRRCR